jgi:nitronate monooxygenase/enoyl-[acyl-carrier protein] reductase II
MCGDDTMLTTPLCALFGIELPIILAPMGTCTSAELAAAVSNAGGLGSIGTLFRSFAAVKRDIDMVQRLTQRPFAINHIPQTLDAEAFRYTVQSRPAVISFALADPGDLVQRAHDAGARVMVQVTTVDQALQAAERGADVISAQGSEFGGYCGEVSTMTLVPQVVDAVSPIPVVASGGIFDGRGIAAALVLARLASISAPALSPQRRLRRHRSGSRRSSMPGRSTQSRPRCSMTSRHCWAPPDLRPCCARCRRNS